jgi:hypothetical protein
MSHFSLLYLSEHPAGLVTCEQEMYQESTSLIRWHYHQPEWPSKKARIWSATNPTNITCTCLRWPGQGPMCCASIGFVGTIRMSIMANALLWLGWCWGGDFQGDSKIGMVDRKLHCTGTVLVALWCSRQDNMMCGYLGAWSQWRGSRRCFAVRGVNTVFVYVAMHTSSPCAWRLWVGRFMITSAGIFSFL